MKIEIRIYYVENIESSGTLILEKNLKLILKLKIKEQKLYIDTNKAEKYLNFYLKEENKNN